MTMTIEELRSEEAHVNDHFMEIKALREQIAIKDELISNLEKKIVIMQDSLNKADDFFDKVEKFILKYIYNNDMSKFAKALSEVEKKTLNH